MSWKRSSMKNCNAKRCCVLPAPSGSFANTRPTYDDRIDYNIILYAFGRKSFCDKKYWGNPSVIRHGCWTSQLSRQECAYQYVVLGGNHKLLWKHLWKSIFVLHDTLGEKGGECLCLSSSVAGKQAGCNHMMICKTALFNKWRSLPASNPTQVDMRRREEVSVGFLSWLRKALLTRNWNCLIQLRTNERG